MNLLKVLVIALLVAGVAHAEVKVLTSASFDKTLAASDLSLVKFYAPWCGHCKNLAPEFDKASAELEDKILLAKVDCTEEAELCGRFEVQGYPTLIIFRNGEKSADYDGPREAAGIVSHMRAQSGPSMKIVKTSEEFKGYLADGRPMCLTKTKAEDSDLAKVMTKIASSMRNKLTFVLTTDESIATENAMETVTIIHGADESSTYSEDMSESAITTFIGRAQVPLVGEINSQTYQMYSSIKDLPIGWLFVNKYTMPSLIPSLKAVAKKHRNDIIMTFINADLYGGVGQQMALPEDVQYPAFVIDIDRKHHIMPGSPKLDATNIEEFITKYLKGEVSPTLRSEPVPSEETVKGMTTIVTTTLNKHVKSGKNTFVLIYAPWCGHCKSFMPDYEAIAAELENEDVVIAKMDGAANDVDSSIFKVDGFPTMYFIPAGKAPVSYDGGRSKADVLAYIKANSIATKAKSASPQPSEQKEDDGDL